MCRRRPIERRQESRRLLDRGRRPRSQSVVSHPDGVRQDRDESQLYLGLSNGSRSRNRGPIALLDQGKGLGGIRFDQRIGLSSGSSRGLRRLGEAWCEGMVLSGRLALFSKNGNVLGW